MLVLPYPEWLSRYNDSLMPRVLPLPTYHFQLALFLEIRSEFVNTVAKCLVGNRLVFIQLTLYSFGCHTTAVTFANMRTHQFSGASYFETLGGHLMRLHFWHNLSPLVTIKRQQKSPRRKTRLRETQPYENGVSPRRFFSRLWERWRLLYFSFFSSLWGQNHGHITPFKLRSLLDKSNIA